MSNDDHDLQQVKAFLSHRKGSEERFRDLLDQLQIAVVEHSPDTSILFANRHAVELFGLDQNEATSRTASDPRWRFHRDDGTVMPLKEFPVVKVLDTLESLQNYVVGVERPGSREVTWTLVDAYPQFDEEKVLRAVQVTFLDITKSRQGAEDLRNERERLINILDSVGDPIFVKDSEHRVVLANRAFCDIFAMDIDAVIGKTLAEHVPEDEREQFLSVDRRVLETGTADVREETLTLQGRGVRNIVTRKGRIVDRSGNILLVGSIHDITERKQAEAARYQSEQRFNDLVNSTDGIVWEADARTFDFVSVSRNAERMLGYPAADWLRSGFWKEHIHPDDRDEAMKYCAARTSRAENHDFEYRFVAADGRVVWLRDVVAVVVENVKPRWLRGIMIDITDSKRAEEERLSLQRQVQQAQKLESLGVLAGGIAHDFNNLLAAILGNAELALDELSHDSLARENIQEIEDASKRAAELVKQMLAYSGKGLFVIEPIQLGSFVEEMAHLLDVSISKKVVLKHNFADNLPTFNGDEAQIRQVIMNLIINASEAIGKQDGVITLSTGAMYCDSSYLEGVDASMGTAVDESFTEGAYVYLEVADTGCGMDDETIEKIFDPFFTTKFTGRGLGLSATSGIVRGHKGAIKISSEVGKGSTFKVFLPANELSYSCDALAAGTGESLAKQLQHEETILIVDDEEAVRAVGKQMVERMGFTALMASDGREAVELFREHCREIGCVLLDLTMPHMDGEEAFHEMRRIQPDAKIIICSGYSIRDATRRFSGMGLAGFLQKPYVMADLRRKLAQLLGP